MMNHNYISTILVIWQTWGIGVAVALIVGSVSFLIYRSKLKAVLHSKGDLQQRVTEYTELLNYAQQNEQKAKEEAETAMHFKSLLLAKLSHEIRTL